MKTDSYTRAVLTVIAICLLILTGQNLNLFPTATANTDQESLNFNSGYVPVPLNEDGSISVRLSPSEEINVMIKGITTSDQLDVNITEVGGRYIYGAIPVEIDD